MAPFYTELRCRSGSKPESAAAIRRELLGRLLAADFKGWNVVVVGETGVHGQRPGTRE